ncbi:MAG TPA: hypothetical protein VLA77_01850 [Candidatus Saccharimonadales bacterium]|nr:hypothetical protein [Candidatus Saccharimonadales bacterium]
MRPRSDVIVVANRSKMIEELISQILTYIPHGQVAVICDRPHALLSVMRKKWKLQDRKLKVDRASTLDKTKIELISQQISMRESLKFSAGSSGQAGVRFMKSHQNDNRTKQIFCDVQEGADIPNGATHIKVKLPTPKPL